MVVLKLFIKMFSMTIYLFIYCLTMSLDRIGSHNPLKCPQRKCFFLNKLRIRRMLDATKDRWFGHFYWLQTCGKPFTWWVHEWFKNWDQSRQDTVTCFHVSPFSSLMMKNSCEACPNGLTSFQTLKQQYCIDISEGFGLWLDHILWHWRNPLSIQKMDGWGHIRRQVL